MGFGINSLSLYKHFVPTALCRSTLSLALSIALAVLIGHVMLNFVTAQNRRRPRTSKPAPQPQAPKGSAAKYSAFLHSSDKHQTAIASIRPPDPPTKKALACARASAPSFDHAAFRRTTFDDRKVDYNNCSICHVTNQNASTGTFPGAADSFVAPAGTFKTM